MKNCFFFLNKKESHGILILLMICYTIYNLRKKQIHNVLLNMLKINTHYQGKGILAALLKHMEKIEPA